MRRIACIVLLLLAGCNGDQKQIIADVCVPLDQEQHLPIEKLAAAKGYDLERTKKVCHQYVVDQMADFAKKMREMGVDKPGPYDAR